MSKSKLPPRKIQAQKFIVVFDLEGTITDDSHRYPLWRDKKYDEWNLLFVNDPPNVDILRLIMAYDITGFKIIILTAKFRKYQNIVAEWLQTYIPYQVLDKFEVIMRPDNNHQTSPDFKKSVLLPSKQYIEIVIDDRKDVCKALKKEGISCLQYHGGNRNYDLRKQDFV